ncbi:LOW QUALITY PROTEIN: uncharacterized protein M6G45_015723 [Spheniscus humboldti]
MSGAPSRPRAAVASSGSADSRERPSFRARIVSPDEWTKRFPPRPAAPSGADVPEKNPQEPFQAVRPRRGSGWGSRLGVSPERCLVTPVYASFFDDVVAISGERAPGNHVPCQRSRIHESRARIALVIGGELLRLGVSVAGPPLIWTPEDEEDEAGVFFSSWRVRFPRLRLSLGWPSRNWLPCRSLDGRIRLPAHRPSLAGAVAVPRLSLPPLGLLEDGGPPKISCFAPRSYAGSTFELFAVGAGVPAQSVSAEPDHPILLILPERFFPPSPSGLCLSFWRTPSPLPVTPPSSRGARPSPPKPGPSPAAVVVTRHPPAGFGVLSGSRHPLPQAAAASPHF